MANTYKKLAQGQLAATVGILYTVPALTSTIISHIRLVNNDTVLRAATLWHDGTANTNKILPAADIGPGGWAEWDGRMTMEAADTLQGQASVATQITYTVYGLEIT